MESAGGKLKKAVFFIILRDGTANILRQLYEKHEPVHSYFLRALFIVCGCFISTVRWKYSLFLRFSPWRDPRLRHFSGYPFGTSRKKHQPFSITQPNFKPKCDTACLNRSGKGAGGLCAPCRKALSLEMIGCSHWPFYPGQWGLQKRSSCINPVPPLRIFHKEFFRMMS